MRSDLSLYNHVAGQHRADLVFRLERLVREWRITGTKDLVSSEIHVQFFLQRLLNVNLRQNTETFFLQLIHCLFYGVVE